jgi:hypothetical protein
MSGSSGTGEAGLGVRGVGLAADEGQAGEPVHGDEVAGQLVLAVVVGDLDVVQAVYLTGSGQDDHREPARDHLQVLVRRGAGHHCEAVDVPGHPGDQVLGAADQRGGDQQCVAAPSRRVLHPADELVRVEDHRVVAADGVGAGFGVGVRVGVVGEAQAEHAGGAAGQPARAAAGDVAEFAGRGEDLVPCGAFHTVRIPVHPGDRSDRHSRLFGHVVDRGSAHLMDRPLSEVCSSK